MSDFNFNCPHCEQKLEAPEEMLGQTIECPSCSGSIELPKPDPLSQSDPPAELRTSVQSPPPSPPPKQTKDCPFCGEEILASARKCKHCGEFLDGSAPPAPSAPQKQIRKPNLAKGEFQCPNCQYIGMPTKKPKGNTLVALLLFFLFALPGLIYVVAYSGYKYLCPKCGYNFKSDVLR